MAKNTKPAIRFRGFTDAWEQRKFGDIATRSSIMTSEKELPRVEYEDIITEAGELNKDLYSKGNEKMGLKFSSGDVLYGKLRPYLHNWLLPTFDGVAVGDFWVLQPQNIDSSFLFRLIQGSKFDEIANQSTGTKMPRADWKLIAKTEFSVPVDIEEQKYIGSYFQRLDNLITLHQRKYDSLVNVKKAMLEKMFPKNGETVPEIRFKGFTDAWEQRKLDYYLEVSTEKNVDNKYSIYDVLSVSGDFGVVNQIEFQGRSFAGASVSNYGIAYTNDVIYTKSPLKVNPYGIIKTNKGKTGIVSVLYGVYHVYENAYAPFIQIYFAQHARLNNYLRPLVNKGAKNTLLISDEEALGGNVIFPTTYNEQKLIGEYFDILDHLITLHQRKLEKLKNIKKSCLEKMFV